MKPISDEQISDILLRYGVFADGPLCQNIRVYMELLVRWNRRVSLTTVTDPIEILRFHFGESMLAAQAIPIRHGRLADVGSGAGFPAVPIHMAQRELSLVLIESNIKKATFLSELSRQLQLDHVEVHRGRMEDLPLMTERFDFVTARALGIDDEFLRWSSTALSSNGILVLWVGEQDMKRISARSGWKWRDPVKIPNSDRRFILAGSVI
ncbi:MAG: 16S rRNA (guanine(527)-N(7))-methyltransferase RsmG [Candidatus Acidiferrales bacterium]